MTSARASELCQQCGDCCKKVVAFLPNYHGEPMAIAREWFRARGIEVIAEQPRSIIVSIPSHCPHLSQGPPWRCDIYDHRPLACRTFDGRRQPGVECKWVEEV